MKTQPLHLTKEECGLMCNLLVIAMQNTGKPFEEQAPQVKMLSTKLANSFKKHEATNPQPVKLKTVFDR